MAKSEEELKSLLMKVKEEREKAGLKLNIQKIKIMASGPITLWQIEGEKVEQLSLLLKNNPNYPDPHVDENLKSWVKVDPPKRRACLRLFILIRLLRLNLKVKASWEFAVSGHKDWATATLTRAISFFPLSSLSFLHVCLFSELAPTYRVD